MPRPLSPAWLAGRAYNAAAHLRNLLVRPPFVMFYLTFTLGAARQRLAAAGFEVEVERDRFPAPYQQAVLVLARRPARRRGAAGLTASVASEVAMASRDGPVAARARPEAGVRETNSGVAGARAWRRGPDGARAARPQHGTPPARHYGQEQPTRCCGCRRRSPVAPPGARPFAC